MALGSGDREWGPRLLRVNVVQGAGYVDAQVVADPDEVLRVLLVLGALLLQDDGVQPHTLDQYLLFHGFGGSGRLALGRDDPALILQDLLDVELNLQQPIPIFSKVVPKFIDQVDPILNEILRDIDSHGFEVKLETFDAGVS